MAFKPLIGVTACVKQIGLHPYHVSGDKYLRAVSVAALGLPVVIPSLGELTEIEDLLAQLDGLLLTGSPSNVEPFHYQGPASAPGTDHDPARDATTLPLLRAAIAAGVPVLGICRGFQEMNVAFGGSCIRRSTNCPACSIIARRTVRSWRCSTHRLMRSLCNRAVCSKPWICRRCSR